MSDFDFFPHAVVWEITFACNMHCIHCGTAAGKKRPDELTTKEALSLIDELADLRAYTIVLSGGEPLLRDDWRQLAERIGQRGVKPCLITNGYAITKETVDDFERLGMSKIGVSFDGPEKTHNYIRQREDSFRKAYNAMEMMSENGHVKYTAVSQVSNINLDELDDIRQLLLDVGCKEWRIQMTTCTGRMAENQNLVLSYENYPKLVDKCIEFKKDDRMDIDIGENIGFYGHKGYKLWNERPYYGCYAGMRVLGVESNGDIKGCLSMPEDFVEGNIRERSITEIWNDPDSFAYNRKFTRDSAEGDCHDCKYLPLCRGGCTVTSYAMTGCRANNPYCTYQIERREGVPEREDTEEVAARLAVFREAMADLYEKA